MFLVDSHCHLDQLDLTLHEGDLSKALKRAYDMDVKYFLCVCITLDQFHAMTSLVKPYQNVSVTVGLHPNEQSENVVKAETLIQLAEDPAVVAIGETGLDYYRSEGDLEWQRQRFREHIEASLQTNKPLIVHSRQAKDDTIRILKETSAEKVGGVMHCFTEDWEMAKAALDLNFDISFSGIVTFRNAETIREVAKKVPLDRLLIETDSPYLAPHPYRGKPNEPAFVRYVAESLADLRGISIEALAESTTLNFFNRFKAAKSVSSF